MEIENKIANFRQKIPVSLEKSVLDMIETSAITNFTFSDDWARRDICSSSINSLLTNGMQAAAYYL